MASHLGEHAKFDTATPENWMPQTTKKSEVYCFSLWVGSNPLFFSLGSGIQLTLV